MSQLPPFRFSAPHSFQSSIPTLDGNPDPRMQFQFFMPPSQVHGDGNLVEAQLHNFMPLSPMRNLTVGSNDANGNMLPRLLLPPVSANNTALDDHAASIKPATAIVQTQPPTKAVKVAGSRRKGKKHRNSGNGGYASDSSEPHERPGKRGRPTGSGNYLDGDVKFLLNLVKAELPLGPRGWRTIHHKYSLWARKYHRPERALKSLETKYKQLANKTKPTGDGIIPPNVLKAQEIEILINERAGTRDLGDSEFCEDGDVLSISSDDEGSVITPNVTAHIARNTSTTERTKAGRGKYGLDVIEKLTDALAPSRTLACDEERAHRGFEQAHYLVTTQQLRDSHATIENLRVQISNLQTRIHESDLARDHAELKLEMLAMSSRAGRPLTKQASPRRHVPQVILPTPPSHTSKSRNKRKYEELHSDGNKEVVWLTETDIDNDTDKENYYSRTTLPISRGCSTLSPLTNSTLPSPSTAFAASKAKEDPAPNAEATIMA